MLQPGCVEACPGCRHREWPQERSEAQKLDFLRAKLSRWAERLEPMRSAERRWGYREKTCLRASWDGTRWDFGFLDLEDRLIAIPDCPVHSAELNAKLRRLSSFLPAGIPLCFVAISGELVTLVLKSASLPQGLKELDWASVGAAGVFANLNPSAGQRVFSSRHWIHLWGDQRMARDGLLYGPSSFQQLIPELREHALGEAARFLRPGPSDSVLDLCSGNGASFRWWRPARFLGVELGGEAVECAEQVFGSGSCLRGRASERIPQLREWLEGASSPLVFANPPRTGLEEAVVEWLACEARPARMAYLSCSAGTLARDLGDFAEAGYGVRKLIPYDFFPQTHHVETLALLELDPASGRHHPAGARRDARAF